MLRFGDDAAHTTMKLHILSDLHFTAGKQFTDYKENSMLRAAVERKFEIIGEALSKLFQGRFGDSLPHRRARENHRMSKYPHPRVRGNRRPARLGYLILWRTSYRRCDEKSTNCWQTIDPAAERVARNKLSRTRRRWAKALREVCVIERCKVLHRTAN